MRVALGFAVLLAAGSANALPNPLPNRGAWVEAHLVASDARLTIDRQAHATIDITLTYRVVAGTLHGVTIAGVRADAIEPSCEVRAEDGSAQVASVLRKDDASAAVELAFEGKGLKRGTYAVHLKGGIALAPVADGVIWRVGWSSPVTNEGLDGARIVLDLPAAPTEPRAIRADAAPGEVDERGDLTPHDAFSQGVVATLRRSAQRDELELVRPHVARGEGAAWTARVDPKAFDLAHPAMSKSAIRTPSIPPVAPVRTPLAVLIAAVGLGFAALMFAKARAAKAIGARPLVPVPGISVLAGAAMAGAVWLEAIRQTTEAAIAVAFTMFLATFIARARPNRSGGAWIGLRFDAMPERANDFYDATRATGATALCLSVIGLVAIARMLSAIDPLAPIWTALDAAVLVPLFFTGVRPPPGPIAALELLRGVRARHSQTKTALVGCVPVEGGDPFELRLHVHPAAPLPGLVSLEVGVRWDRSGWGFAPALEILARVRAESAAHGRLLAASDPAPSHREPGRKPDERVFRYAPQSDDFDRVLSALWMLLEERRTKATTPGVERRKRDSRLSSPTAHAAAAH